MDTQYGPFMDVLFNGTKGPFSDARVRRAVAHAVRREDIVQAAFFGRGKVLEGVPIVEGTPFWDAELSRGWRYDVAEAKRLLAAAGVPNGFQTVMLSSAQFGMHKDTAEVVQQHLAAIGIQCELKLPEWSTRVRLGMTGQYEIAIHGVAADNNDPDGLTVRDGYDAVADPRPLLRPAGAAHRRVPGQGPRRVRRDASASPSTRTCSAPPSRRCRSSVLPGARRPSA